MDLVTFFQMDGGAVFGLYGQEALSEDCTLNAPKPGGITLGLNAQSREEVDALFAQALAAGAKALQDPHETPWGGYTGYVADPDGHPWEFSHVAQMQPDEQGALILPDRL